MLTFFTLLVITYSLDGEEAQARILYTSEAACITAMEQVAPLLDPAITLEMVQCQKTTAISRSPRPKARP